MSDLPPVIVEIRGDIARLRSDMRTATGVIDSSVGKIEKSTGRMSSAIANGMSAAKGAAIGFISAISVDAIIRATMASLDYASSLGETAQQLGVSTAALQEYRYAATQVGLSAEEMDQALSQLTRRIGEAQAGTKAQAAAFAELGISVNGLTTEDAIPAIAEALSKIESPARRAAIEMDLFGRAGQKLEPLLSQGAGAVNELREAAHRLGIVLTDEMIAKADTAADKMSELSLVLKAQLAATVAENTDGLISFANGLAYIAQKAIEATAAFGQFADRIANESIIKTRSSAQDSLDINPLLPNGMSHRQWLRSMAASSSARPGAGLPGVPAMPAIGGGGGTSTGAAHTGPDPRELARRRAQAAAAFADDIGRSRVELLEATANLTDSVSARYLAEVARIEEDRAAYQRRLTLDEDLTQAQRDQLLAAYDLVDERKKAIAEQERFNALAENEAQIAQDSIERRREQLQAQADMADNATDRLAAEYRLIDLAQEEERARLELILATKATSSAEYAIAEARMAELNRVGAQRRDAAARQYETPAQRFMRELNRSSGAINEDLQNIAVNGLNSLNDGITDAIMGAENLGDVFKGVANSIIAELIRIAVQQQIIKPLANSLFGSGGGGGGNFLASIGSLFGRASGGYVAPGQMVRVNESGSPGRVEGWQPTGSGKVIPMGQMNAMAAKSSSGGIVTVRLDLSGDIDARITSRSADVAIEVVKAAAPSLIGAAKDATISTLTRPTV